MKDLEVHGNGDYAYIAVKNDKEEYFTKEDLLIGHPELKGEIEACWNELQECMHETNKIFAEEGRAARDEYINFLKNDGCYYDGIDY